MNSSTVVIASFVTFIFCALALSLSMSKEQKDLSDSEDLSDLSDSYTSLQNMMLNLAAISLGVFSVAGVFMIAELVWRFK